MERNYDEIIAEMLLQIDRHTEELDKHSKELTRQSEKSEKFALEHTAKHESMMLRLDKMGEDMEKRSREAEGRFKDAESRFKDWEKISEQHLSQLVNTATILDRIIRRNDLIV